MATFSITFAGSSVAGTAESDTFNINTDYVTAWGLEGDDVFNCAISTDFLLADGGAGNDSVFIPFGAVNNILGGEGNDWLGLDGGGNANGNVLDGGNGDDVVGATASTNWLLGGNGNDQLRVNGNSNTLEGGAGDDQLQVKGDANTLDGGTGNDSLFVSSGNENNLFAGVGNDWLGVGGDFHRLSGGDGSDWIGATGLGHALFGDGGNDTLFGVGDIHTLIGGEGDDWLGVSGNTNGLFGGTGNDYLAGTGDFNGFDGGLGNDQMVAAAGHTGGFYVFHPGYAQDSITGFVANGGAFNGVIDLRGFGLANLAALDPYMSQVGSDTVITLNGADILTLKDINEGTLVADDFIFV
jgi:Ca2+-binding RTX toxin-like protein